MHADLTEKYAADAQSPAKKLTSTEKVEDEEPTLRIVPHLSVACCEQNALLKESFRKYVC